MKFSSETIRKAWSIRKEVAKELNCNVNDVIWSECLKMASEEAFNETGIKMNVQHGENQDGSFNIIVTLTGKTFENKDLIKAQRKYSWGDSITGNFKAWERAEVLHHKTVEEARAIGVLIKEEARVLGAKLYYNGRSIKIA